MADQVLFNLNFDDSAAIATINRVANTAQRRFNNIGLGSNVSRSFKNANKEAERFNRTLDNVSDRFLAYAAATQIVYGLSRAFQSLISNAIAVQKSMAEIQVNVQTTASGLDKLSKGLFKIATETSQSFYAAADAAAEFGRQGLELNKILDATKSALILNQTTGIAIEEAVAGLTVALNTFDDAGLSYVDVVNKMADADTNFAVSSKDLVQFISRVGSTAKDANVSFEQTLALATSLRQITGRTGSVSGNSVKSILTRLQRSSVQSSLNDIGIATQNDDGSFIPQIKVLTDLAREYDNLSDSQQAYISEQVGGVFQINAVKALMSDLAKETGVYAEALKKVSAESNAAVEKSEFLTNTAAGGIQGLKNQFTELAGDIGKLGLADSIQDLAASLSSALNQVSDGFGTEIGKDIGSSLIKGIIKSVTGPGLILFTVTLAKFSKEILGNFRRDISSQFLNSGIRETKEKNRLKIQENDLQQKSLNSQLQQISAISKGNLALKERLTILTQIAAQNGITVASSVGGVRGARRNFASGLDPISQEMMEIGKRTGGARSSAKPVVTNLKGSGRAVVNTDEYIVRNYLGSGKDAVFNRNMVQSVGGIGQLGNFGRVEKVKRGSGMRLLGSSAGNFASGSFSSRSVDELIKIAKGKNMLQVQGAVNELKKRGVLDDPDSIKRGVPKSALSPRAQIIVEQRAVNQSRLEANARAKRSAQSALGRSATRFNDNERRRLEQKTQAEQARQQALRLQEERLQGAIADEGTNRSMKLRAESKMRQFIHDNPTASRRKIQGAAERIFQQTNVRIPESEQRSFARETSRNRRQRIGSRIGFGAFAAPIVGQIAADAFGAGPGTSRAITSASTGLALGSTFGPQGALLGGLAGGALGALSNANDNILGLDKLKEAAEKSADALDKNKQAVTNFSQAVLDIERILDDPKSTVGDLKNAQGDRKRALNSASSEVRRALLTDNTDLAKKLIAQQEADFRIKQATATFAGRLSNDPRNGVFTSIPRRLAGGAFFESDASDFNSIIDSSLSSVDFEELGSKDDNTSRFLLKQLKDGNFEKSLLGLAKAEKISKENYFQILKQYNSLGSAAQTGINKNLRLAVEFALETEALAQQTNEQEKQNKKIVTRFSGALGNLSRKNELSQLSRAQGAAARNFNISTLSAQPEASTFFRNALGSSSKQFDIISDKNKLQSETTEALSKFIKDLFSENASNAVSVLGGGFQEGFVKAAQNPENIDEMLVTLNKMFQQDSSIGPASLEEFRNLSHDYQKGLFQINTQLQVEQKQLQVLTAIEKKTKFDELITAALDANAAVDQGFNNQTFNQIRRDVINPNKDIKSKQDNTVSSLINRGNANGLYEFLVDQVIQAREFLRIDNLKKGRGEVGANVEDRARAQSIITRGQRAERFAVEAGLASDGSGRDNLTTSTATRGAIDRASLAVGSDLGGIDGIQKALEILTQQRGALLNGEVRGINAVGPNNLDVQRLDDLISVLNQFLDTSRSTSPDSVELVGVLSQLHSLIEGQDEKFADAFALINKGLAGEAKRVVGDIDISGASGNAEQLIKEITILFQKFNEISSAEEESSQTASAKRSLGLNDNQNPVIKPMNDVRDALVKLNTTLNRNTLLLKAGGLGESLGKAGASLEDTKKNIQEGFASRLGSAPLTDAEKTTLNNLEAAVIQYIDNVTGGLVETANILEQPSKT